MGKQVMISEIEIWDLKAFRHFKASLGQLVYVEGRNGAGKTSFLLCTQMFFEEGGDPKLIRMGCAEGRAVMTLSNGYKAEKIQRRNGYEIKVFDPEGGVIPAPVSYLKKLLPRNSFNPADFLDDMDIKRRTDFLLAHLPVEFTGPEVLAALAATIGDMPPLDPGPAEGIGAKLGLKEFDTLLDLKVSARSEINRKIENLRGTQETLRGSLPKDSTTDWVYREREIRSELAGVEADLNSKALEVNQAHDRQIEQVRAAAKLADAQDREQMRAFLGAVSTLERECRSFMTSSVPEAASAGLLASALPEGGIEGFISTGIAIANRAKATQESIAGIEQRRSEALSGALGELQERRAALSVDLGAAEAKAAEQQRGAGVRDALAKAEAECSGEVMRYEQLTVVIQALNQLKASKMKAIQIPGFDIIFRKEKGARSETAVITINGLGLDELNRAQSLFVAIKLILLSQKDNDSPEQLHFLIFEGAELTESTREELATAVKRAGLQLVITAPVDGVEDLRVTSI
jgi:hypothetical protein